MSEQGVEVDEQRDEARGRSWWVLAILVLVPLVVVGVAIALAIATSTDDETSTPRTPSRPPETITYIIPPGTAERMQSGQLVDDVIPEYLELVVGDTIEVENRDETTHQFGPIVVRAGETAVVTFFEPGRYQGACTVGDHDTVTIQVI
jgi:flagellar basal body-associated protein FliL